MIAGGVEVLFYGEVREFGAEPFASLKPDGGPGYALGAGVVAGEGAEFVEMCEDCFGIDHDSRSTG